MNTANRSTAVQDPVEQLNDVLQRTWYLLCCTYDAAAAYPDFKTLFYGASIAGTFQISQAVLANMLLEVMENIGRFSPWYTRPARAFGLLEVRGSAGAQKVETSTHRRFAKSGSQTWLLAPEAVMKWQLPLAELSQVIEANYPFIQAMLLVEDLMDRVEPGDEWVSAHCRCHPPREIQVTQEILDQGDIRCDACLYPFR